MGMRRKVAKAVLLSTAGMGTAACVSVAEELAIESSTPSLGCDVVLEMNGKSSGTLRSTGTQTPLSVIQVYKHLESILGSKLLPYSDMYLLLLDYSYRLRLKEDGSLILIIDFEKEKKEFPINPTSEKTVNMSLDTVAASIVYEKFKSFLGGSSVLLESHDIYFVLSKIYHRLELKEDGSLILITSIGGKENKFSINLTSEETVKKSFDTAAPILAEQYECFLQRLGYSSPPPTSIQHNQGSNDISFSPTSSSMASSSATTGAISKSIQGTSSNSIQGTFSNSMNSRKSFQD